MLITGERNERGIPSAVFLVRRFCARKRRRARSCTRALAKARQHQQARLRAARARHPHPSFSAARLPSHHRSQDEIPTLLSSRGLSIEDLYGELNTLHSKYKLMESQLEEGRARARSQVPELEASLSSLDMLERKAAAGETATTFYNLSDVVYVPARIVPRDLVAVWMGAGVMLEYSYGEARELLSQQLAAAGTKMATNSADLAFLRDQIITTEVNIARTYNFSVKEARRKKLEGGEGGA